MIGSVVVFILVLSVLILVHELGHFIAAKRAGIWVEEFGFGIPPRVWGKKIGETIYSVNLLPFGGFVRLHGENAGDSVTNQKRAFLNKSKRLRTKIVVAGVLMNVVLGIVSFAVVYSFSGIPKDSGEVKVLEIDTGSPAQDKGIVAGDIILKFNKDAVSNTSNFAELSQENKGKRITLEIKRGDQKKTITLKSRSEYPEGEGPIGITISSVELYYPPYWQRPFIGIYYGTKEALFWGKEIVLSLTNMVKKAFIGEVPKDIAGPVGIFALTSEAASIGLLAVINFVGILSINLAILNIIPFPALDGGRLMFIGLEGIIGKKVLPKVESALHTIGFIILIALLVLITISDVRRLVTSGGVDGFLKSFAN